MLTLLTYPSGYGQFSLSPFCVKAAMLLTYSGQPWQREDHVDPRKMPHAKLPVLRADENLIPDSGDIRVFLEQQGASFDDGLTDIQKAQSRALIRMAEEHLYFHLVMDRWGNEEVWPAIREEYFRAIPPLLRRPITNQLRKTLLKGLNVHGIARFSPRERLDRVEHDLEAIHAYLWQSPFLLDNKPTSADFSVAPILDAIRRTPVDTPLSRRVSMDRLLTDYLARMDDAVPLP